LKYSLNDREANGNGSISHYFGPTIQGFFPGNMHVLIPSIQASKHPSIQASKRRSTYGVGIQSRPSREFSSALIGERCQDIGPGGEDERAGTTRD
jgi:hypothetical protein